jgi:hypothetical protein
MLVRGVVVDDDGVIGQLELTHPVGLQAMGAPDALDRAALIIGLGSVAAPFFIMQPAMGAGIAASRTPKPWAARMRSVATHFVFGIGLYIAGVTRQMLLSV